MSFRRATSRKYNKPRILHSECVLLKFRLMKHCSVILIMIFAASVWTLLLPCVSYVVAVCALFPLPLLNTLIESNTICIYLSKRNASVAHEVLENRMKSDLLPYVLLRIMRRFPLRSTGSALVCICLLCSIWPRCPNTDATKSRRPLP